MKWLKGIGSGALFWFITIIGAIGTAMIALRRERAAGKREAIQEGIEDASKRVEKGAGAVADGRKRGGPDDRVQHNDAAW